MGSTLCVHVTSPSGEAEFRFASASYRVVDGALLVFDDKGSDLMALAPGTWRAAWPCDAQGSPLGLLGANHGSPAFRDAALSEPHPRSDAPKPDSVSAIAAALTLQPYAGLAEFAHRLGLGLDETEKAVAASLGRGVDVDAVALAAVQEKLDGLMPEIMAGAPHNLAQILSQLREKDPQAGFDLIQLRVWIKRNPLKR